MDINLTFINNSNDANNSQVVIFQKNVASTMETAVAWNILQVGRNDRRQLTFSQNMDAGVQDSFGAVSIQQPVQNGQQLSLVSTDDGAALTADVATNHQQVVIKNGLQEGSIDAQIYKDGKLLAMQSGVAPQQQVAFSFGNTIWIGMIQDSIQEGGVLTSTVLSDINTEISLLGITSADIIITGGGPGPDSTPFKFTLVPTAS
jgi:hypothetical protein